MDGPLLDSSHKILLANQRFLRIVNFYPCMLRSEFAAKLESMIGYPIIHSITNVKF